jgi:hypothetical protein
MRNFFKDLFRTCKNKRNRNSKFDLSRWYNFLSEPDYSIRSVLDINHIDDIASALVYTDNNTKQRFKDAANLLQIHGLENAIKKKQNISKNESDKAKLLLLSTYELKGFTPLPGLQHL